MASYANFGLIPYGHSMMGRLWFNSSNEDACEEFPDNFFYGKKDQDLMKRLENDEGNEEDLEKQLLEDMSYLTPFYLADRGTCTFVEKVRNIEEAGAGLAIIVDTKVENVTRIVMSDDGSGAGLRIPSMLISNREGLKLLDFMKTASEDTRK